MNRETLKRRGFQTRILAMKKGLTGREIAKHLGCDESLVSYAFRGKRIDALRRVQKFVKSYRQRAAA